MSNEPSDNAKRPIPVADTLPLAADAHSGSRSISPQQASAAYDATVATDATDARVAKAARLPVDTVIGERYVIEQHVSSGGFGAVYRASDRQIRNHHVALKLLHAPAADEQARQAALRELTLIASVSHPSVVQFKDYGWHEGRLWFAMPWYRGATLAQRYAAPGWTEPLTRAQARPIFERSAQGLAAMHEVGINHHDIKPDNIFLAQIAGFDAGLPVLLDLGIASTREEGPKGMTLEYASPETAASALGESKQGVGPEADVFSLALVLRNLLEPQTVQPVTGETLAFLHRRATEPLPAPTGEQFRYLRPAFARWLHLDPAQRPTAAQFASELALLTAPEEQREARMRMLRRVGPLVAVGLVVLLLLVRQVRREAAQLDAEKSLLDQQIKTTEELRTHSLQQLQQLEAESKAAGDQALQRATNNAKQFRILLERSEAREAALQKQLQQLGADKEALATQQQAAVVERERVEGELAAAHQSLAETQAKLPKAGKAKLHAAKRTP